MRCVVVFDVAYAVVAEGEFVVVFFGEEVVEVGAEEESGVSDFAFCGFEVAGRADGESWFAFFD